MTLSKQINRKLTRVTSLRRRILKRIIRIIRIVRLNSTHQSLINLRGFHFLRRVINKVVHAVPNSSFHLVKIKPSYASSSQQASTTSLSRHTDFFLSSFTPLVSSTPKPTHRPQNSAKNKLSTIHSRTLSPVQTIAPTNPTQTNPIESFHGLPASFAPQSDQ
jgi:hypothetical protein